MRRLLVALLLLAAACTPRIVVPDAERERARAELAGKRRFLRVAVYEAPLFGDDGKLMLLAAPPGEIDLLRTAGGEIVPPPAPLRVLPPGTPVVVEQVEFPTGMTIALRVVTTPRYHPWAYLRIADDPRPHVVVLSQTDATADQVIAELEQVLTSDDPTAAYQALPEDQRAAVLRKGLVEGMGTRAVAMAWGLPERIRMDRPADTEVWRWPGDQRRAEFLDGKLVRWDRKP